MLFLLFYSDVEPVRKGTFYKRIIEKLKSAFWSKSVCEYNGTCRSLVETISG